ncbi:leucine carboxyl methyltransferase 1 [Contarinia nasturtii]|uniref:leucine carboxyl methyltransferase 1 n=1 Tax=Contarinia nasturtii TaxID=265458 RepID=UPI0012D3D5C7|nr:leucine carboxyl methyltransferase 1 [Contarinia nasturtii]
MMDRTMFNPSGDDGVISTNDDASGCKRHAVRVGYWKDDYIGSFVSNTDRKAPEINRGYFARVKGIEIFIDKFLEKTGDKCQIINLGCGFDTLYWRLRDAGHMITNFIELDFPMVTSRKCMAIKRHKNLLSKLHCEDGEVRFNPTDMHAANYHVMGVDLRHIDEIENKLKQAEVDFTLPTLFLAECVLVYIESEHCSNLLKWLSSHFSSGFIVNYEQVNMNDRFGEVMLSNLRSRGCDLAGVEACQTLDTQIDRFLNCGWHGAKAWDMVQVYQSLPSNEIQRIEKLELLDEAELLTQLFQHYCISISWTGEEFEDIEIT